MPSRQSLSKAIGSSPRRVSRSFSTSSISRNDMCSEMSGPGRWPSCRRRTRSCLPPHPDGYIHVCLAVRARCAPQAPVFLPRSRTKSVFARWVVQTGAGAPLTDAHRQSSRSSVLTCSSAASSRRTRRPAAPCAGPACRPRPRTPRPRRRRTRRRCRSASPSSVCDSARKCPPQDSRRTSASMHISSPSSKKSATRPARSSAWFSSSPVPSTLTSDQNSCLQLADLADRLAQALLGALHPAVVPHDVARAPCGRSRRCGCR